MRLSDVTAARAMPTRLLLAKLMRHGPELWKMRARHAQDVYVPVDDFGQERKPSLQSIRRFPGTKSTGPIQLAPGIWHPLLTRVALVGEPFELFRGSPARLPYGCEFWHRDGGFLATPSAFVPMKAW